MTDEEIKEVPETKPEPKPKKAKVVVPESVKPVKVPEKVVEALMAHTSVGELATAAKELSDGQKRTVMPAVISRMDMLVDASVRKWDKKPGV